MKTNRMKKPPAPASGREYAQYAASLKKLRGEELDKPAGERNAALIEECERAELYCGQRLGELVSAKRSFPRGRRAKILLIAAAVIALLLFTNAVSFASGKALLFDSLYWNVKRFRVEDDGTVNYENGSFAPRSEGEKHSFGSEEKLLDFFGEELLLPGSIKGVYFVSASSQGTADNALINCEYRVNGKKLLLSVDFCPRTDEEEIASELLSKDEYSVEYRGGRMVGENDSIGFVYFMNGGSAYLITGSQGTEILEDMALRMIRSGGVK